MIKPLPLSHSSLEKFKTCPKQFYHLKVAKDVQDSPGEAALWGSRVHKAFEVALEVAVNLPPELSMYQHYIDLIRRFRGERYVEHELGVRQDLSSCGFSDHDVWARCIIDVLIVDGDRAFILDHKTGKVKPSTQLMFSSLLVFSNFPQVETCQTAFYWLNKDELTKATYERKNAPSLWLSYELDLARYNFAFENNVWIEKQSGLCNGWCPIQHCQFWKEKR